jgi:hypothetical protein
MHKNPKIENIKKSLTRIPTPNLTLYYPLEMSILSVSIRFMGTILLLIFSFCISFFLIFKFIDLSLEVINLIFLLSLFLLVSSSFYHVLNSVFHIIPNETKTLTESKVFRFYSWLRKKIL